MNCKTCKFWLEGEDRGLGDCRRHAPTPETSNPGIIGPASRARWPQTSIIDFCGDFQPHKTSQGYV